MLSSISFTLFRQFKTKNRSITATAFGIILTTVAIDLTSFTLPPALLGGTINYVGGVFTVTGFSLVLYSRLHLVTSYFQALRILLRVVLLIGVLVYVPTFVSGYLPNLVMGEKIYKIAYRLEIVFAI
jgi:hypothetical protein